jgi:alpha-1,3-rhamnosyl/mannosyltransferase
VSADAPLIAFNCTAYDHLPSGARTRALGLAAGVLREGASVVLYTPKGVSLRGALEHESGDSSDAARVHEVETPLDPVAPVVRAVRSERWFRRHLTRSADLFVTDYYPVVDRVPTAVTVHDLRYLAAASDEPRARVVWFRTFYPRLLHRAPHVLVPTAAVGSEVVFHVGIEAERIHVVPNALSRAWRDAAPSSETYEHLLWIGTPGGRKRLEFLLRAYAVAASSVPLRPLVLAGRGGEPDRLPDLASELVAEGKVIPRGVVPDDELVDLVRSAAALLHPSRYEGFGMPVVEALSVGTPVIAAHIPSVAGVARGGAHLLPPDDMRAWVRALRDMGRSDLCLVRPRAEVVERVRGTTWQDAARVLLDVIPQ